ncbi:hypothetical protein Cha6605_0154 [Chamaesiphon minutus PCC 6605]|uniref:Uncharacterized protein n=1 Tax=Chamaesiphon minutus (strain ATCC 27169 / PCC 6605) TaxID=1173020 RepID=K9U9G0_CHAP6|nr:hypothetical protein Cha6605_0154 [Chamaesiphon minutus PCC 6605]
MGVGGEEETGAHFQSAVLIRFFRRETKACESRNPQSTIHNPYSLPITQEKSAPVKLAETLLLESKFIKIGTSGYRRCAAYLGKPVGTEGVLPAGLGTLPGMDVGVPGRVESLGTLIVLGLVLELPLGSLGLALVPGVVVPEGVVSVPAGVVSVGIVPEGVTPAGVVLSGVVLDGVVVSVPEGFFMLVPLVGFFLLFAAGVFVVFFLVVWVVLTPTVET